jgi:dTDP-4-amino-4,6-dideoxygalactose transaminase
VIDLFQPAMGPDELAAATQALDRPRLSRGPLVGEFEDALADVLGRGHVIAVSSGTAALHLAVRAAGWGSSDLVVTSPFGFIAVPNALLYEGVTPAFSGYRRQLDVASLGDLVEHIRPAASSFLTSSPRSLLSACGTCRPGSPWSRMRPISSGLHR